uniref:Uncharacterized protein n=1 Tax=Romanomermis culicivorax TaxID=13658 RepID=A0A915HZR9_ROMCU
MNITPFALHGRHGEAVVVDGQFSITPWSCPKSMVVPRGRQKPKSRVQAPRNYFRPTYLTRESPSVNEIDLRNDAESRR